MNVRLLLILFVILETIRFSSLKPGSNTSQKPSLEETGRISTMTPGTTQNSETAPFFNMCMEKEMKFNYTLNLTTPDSVKECQCFLENGNFTLLIRNLMLITWKEKGCSSVQLLISSKNGSRIFSCNASREDFGIVINETVLQGVPPAYISVINYGNKPPYKIMLSVIPQDTIKIICLKPTLLERITTPSMTTATTQFDIGTASQITTDSTQSKSYVRFLEIWLGLSVIIILPLIGNQLRCRRPRSEVGNDGEIITFESKQGTTCPIEDETDEDHVAYSVRNNRKEERKQNTSGDSDRSEEQLLESFIKEDESEFFSVSTVEGQKQTITLPTPALMDK